MVRIASALRLALLAAVALLPAAPAALAHAFLRHAAPAVGSTVSAPGSLRLTFTERVEPLFSRIAVQAPSGAAVPLAKPHAAQDSRALEVPLPRLAPGTYTVTWRVTSVDTHKTEGSFHFTVAP